MTREIIKKGIVDHELATIDRKSLCASFCLLLGWYPSRKVLSVKFNLSDNQLTPVITALRKRGLICNKTFDEVFLNELKND